MPQWIRRTALWTVGICGGLFVLGTIVGPQTEAERKDSALEGDPRSLVQPSPTPPPSASDDAELARGWGIPDDVFRRAKSLSEEAHTACRHAIIDAARWDYKTDWIPDFTWRTDGKAITITGRDVHLQNGFGAYSNLPYRCDWDMETKVVTRLDAQ